MSGSLSECSLRSSGRASGRVPLFRPENTRVRTLYTLRGAERRNTEETLIRTTANIKGACLTTFSSGGCREILFITRHRRVLGRTTRSFGGMHSSSSCKFFGKSDGYARGSIVFTSITAFNEIRCLGRGCFTPSCFACIIVSRFRRTIGRRCREVISCFGPGFLLKLATAPREVSKGGVCIGNMWGTNTCNFLWS